MFTLNFIRANKDICAKFTVVMRLYLLSKLRARPELRVTNYASVPAKLSAFESFEIQHKTPVVRKLPPIPMAHYGGRHHVTMLKGTGIGPECMAMVMQIFTPSKMEPQSICEINYLGPNHQQAPNERKAQLFCSTGEFMKIAQNGLPTGNPC